MDEQPLQVGDRLYMVPRARYPGVEGYMPITKVGRKWLELAGGKLRADKKTLAIDAGGYSPGAYLYRTKEAYLDTVEAERLRLAIRRAVDYSSYDVPLPALRAAADALGIE